MEQPAWVQIFGIPALTERVGTLRNQGVTLDVLYDTLWIQREDVERFSELIGSPIILGDIIMTSVGVPAIRGDYAITAPPIAEPEGEETTETVVPQINQAAAKRAIRDITVDHSKSGFGSASLTTAAKMLGLAVGAGRVHLINHSMIRRGDEQHVESSADERDLYIATFTPQRGQALSRMAVPNDTIYSFLRGNSSVANKPAAIVVRHASGAVTLIINLKPAKVIDLKDALNAILPDLSVWGQKPFEALTETEKEALRIVQAEALRQQQEIKIRARDEIALVMQRCAAAARGVSESTIAEKQYDLDSCKVRVERAERVLQNLTERAAEFQKNNLIEPLQREVARIQKLGDNVSHEGNTLNVTFKGMEMVATFDRVKRRYLLGDLMMHIPMDQPTAAYVTLSGGQPGLKPHPHCHADRRICYGEHQSQADSLMRDGHFAALVAWTKEFLQKPNVNDSYGSATRRWPLVDAEPEIALPIVSTVSEPAARAAQPLRFELSSVEFNPQLHRTPVVPEFVAQEEEE